MKSFKISFLYVLQQGKFIALNKSTLIKQLNFQREQIQALKSTQQLQVHQALQQQQSYQDIQPQQHHQILNNSHLVQIQQTSSQQVDDKLRKPLSQISPRALPQLPQTMVLTRLPQSTVAPNTNMMGMRTPFRQKPLPLGAGTIRGAVPIISSPVATVNTFQQSQVCLTSQSFFEMKINKTNFCR